MTTKIELINRALNRLKEDRISDLNDIPNKDLEYAVEHTYPDFKKSILQKRNWSFSTKFEILQLLSEREEYTFLLPTDYLDLVSVFSDVEQFRPTEQYRLVVLDDLSRVGIQSEHNILSLRYVYDVSELLFPPDFTEAFEYGLAAELAVPLNGKTDYEELYRNRYERLITEAGINDARNKPITGFNPAGRYLQGERYSQGSDQSLERFTFKYI